MRGVAYRRQIDQVKHSFIYRIERDLNVMLCRREQGFPNKIFIERDRGMHTLSEREYLWNHRIEGTLNIQKKIDFIWRHDFICLMPIFFILYY